jgi:hypothetical protein
MIPCNNMLSLRKWVLPVLASLVFSTIFNASAVIRDGGVDPANLGQGGWLYILSSATNKLGNTVPSVTNANSMFGYLRSQGMSYVIVKAATSNVLWGATGNNVPIGSPNAAFTTNLVQAAHANGLFIFASTRSWGNDIPGEIAVVDYAFQQGADGFIFDAESEWESSQPWIGTNGPALAWQLCSTVRQHWPTKMIAHNPYDTLYLHSSFPFKEFGYWCDVVMPQVYHHAASQGNAIAAIHWTDVNYKRFQDSLYNLSPSVINGETIYWTNSIKPLCLMRDVYNGNAGTPVHPAQDVADFLDYLVADPNCVTAGGYQGSDYFRSELHSPAQWANIKAATVGHFSNVVNNIVLDDATASRVGAWTMVKTIDADTGANVFFTGASGDDTNSFGTNYWSAARGNGSRYIQFNPQIVTAGDYNVLQWHPTRFEASAAVPVTIQYDGGISSFDVDQQIDDGTWSFIARLPFFPGTNNFVRFSDAIPEGDGIAMVDGLKMVFVPPTSVPATPTNLTGVAISTSQVDLDWSDNSDNETGFVIGRSFSSGGPYTTIAVARRNVTHYTDLTCRVGSTYYYVVSGTNYLGASTNSNQVVVKTPGAPTPPSISSQPQSQTISLGTAFTFSVDVFASAPLGYQWRLNGTNISGATDSSYAKTSVQWSDAGNYSVVVTNLYGAKTSSNAVLTVVAIPASITNQPQNRIVPVGNNVQFSVGATGSMPIYYQWRLNGSNIDGATSSVLNRIYVQPIDAGNYSVVVSNDFGGGVSANAQLTVTVSAAGITSQPQNQTIVIGQTATFSVASSGAPPISYQWRYNGADIAGETTPSLVLTNVSPTQAGNYSVIVSNPYGVAPSGNAALKVVPVFKWTNLWTVAPGSAPYLGTNNHTERGMAYSKTSNKVLLISRAIGTKVVALDGDTGAYLHDLTIDTTVVKGGTATLLMIGVADDGAVYAGNLTTSGSSSPFRLYRWADDNATNSPTLVYSGDPGAGNSQRWGDTLTVRGAGTNTQIAIASRSGPIVSILTTTNGVTFSAKPLNIAGVQNGAFGQGLTFGANNTFWGKASGLPLRQVEFNLTNGIGTVLRSYLTNTFPATVSPVSMNPAINFLACVNVAAPDELQVYDLNLDDSAPTLRAKTNFAGANLNSFGSGSVQFADKRIYALDSNNGLLAMEVTIDVTPPLIISQPQSQMVTEGSSLAFTVSVFGSAPFNYQWLFNGTNIAGASTTSLVLTNVQASAAGNYSVIASNSAGFATSSNALLQVNIRPTITGQPSSRTVRTGTNIQFTVTATGTAPLFYQWKFNGTNVGTSSVLSLLNVGTNQQGTYSVIVTNIAGQAASSNATLTVTLAPQFQSATRTSDGVVHLVFTGDITGSYLVERSTNLVQWDPVTNFNYSSGYIEVIDNSGTNMPNAFYRSRH